MSAICALRQFTSASCRVAARPVLRSGRTLLVAQHVSRTTPSLPATRAFSTTLGRLSAGASDVLFSQKIAEELKFERESAQPEEPDFLKSFKAEGIWTIEDAQGNDEVTFTRKFGNESIRVMFSIADIQNMQEEGESDYAEEDGQEGAEEDVQTYPIRTSFAITKDGAKGSLNVDAICQGGVFVVDNVSYYPDGKLGTELTAEADWKRRGLYIGPQFDTLDASVQEEFEKWLNERGVNENLAAFIPEYVEYKEQKEYVRWLENVKNFVEA